MITELGRLELEKRMGADSSLIVELLLWLRQRVTAKEGFRIMIEAAEITALMAPNDERGECESLMAGSLDRLRKGEKGDDR